MTRIRLLASALLSLTPFIALVVEDALGKERPEVSLFVLWVTAALASLHLWVTQRALNPVALLSKVIWTAALFIAGAFTLPIYWCLHLYLPAKLAGESDGRTFVVLTRESNPLRAHMLIELLIAAGIDVRVHGTEDAAGVGLGQFIVAQRFEVPEAQLEEATEVLHSEPLESELSPELSEDHPIEPPPVEDTAALDTPGAGERKGIDLAEIAVWVVLVLVTLKALDMF